MLQIETKHFGKVEVSKDKIIEFSHGIFGFEKEREFTILFDAEGKNSPFCWLQSIKTPSICLPLIDPFLLYNDYAPEIADDEILKIGELNQDHLNVFTVVVIPKDIKEMTTNLKAPILINVHTRKGIQVIVEDEIYGIRHNLYDHIKCTDKEK